MLANELHVISTGKQDLAVAAAIAAVIHPYVTAFHLREKTKTAEELQHGLQLFLEAGVPRDRLYINGHPAAALATGIKGVHMPGSAPGFAELKAGAAGVRIGVSVHSTEEALRREGEGADYVMFGHVFATGSKPGLAPRGLEQLRHMTSRMTVPVIAIGGMVPDRIEQVLQAGAAGVAVMSGVMEAADPLHAVRQYAEALGFKSR